MATNRRVERDFYDEYDYQHYVHPERQQLVYDYNYDYSYDYNNDYGGWDYPQNNLSFYSRSYRRNRGYERNRDPRVRHEEVELPPTRDQRAHFDKEYQNLRSVPNNNLTAAEKEEMQKQLALQEMREYQHEEYLGELAMQGQREWQYEVENSENKFNEDMRRRLSNLRDERDMQPPPQTVRRKNNQRSVHDTAADLR